MRKDRRPWRCYLRHDWVYWTMDFVKEQLMSDADTGRRRKCARCGLRQWQIKHVQADGPGSYYVYRWTNFPDPKLAPEPRSYEEALAQRERKHHAQP